MQMEQKARVPPPTTELVCQCSTFPLNDRETGGTALVFITLWELKLGGFCLPSAGSLMRKAFSIFGKNDVGVSDEVQEKCFECCEH